jgi:hypothetical protein
MVDWDTLRRNARSGERPPEWPQDVQGISMEGLGLLGLDRRTQLYWDGRPIVIRRRLSLSPWQKLATVIIALGGLGAVAQGIDSGHNFGCKLQLWTIGCGAITASAEVAPIAPPTTPQAAAPAPAPDRYGSGIIGRIQSDTTVATPPPASSPGPQPR